MTPSLKEFLLQRQVLNPKHFPNFEAWYDIQDETTVFRDGANRVILVADKSGNSAVNCLVLNGVAGNSASSPSAAPVKITGDIDVVARISLPNWAAQFNTVVAKYLTAGSFSYRFSLTATGALRIDFSVDGTATIAAVSSVVLSFTNFQTGWVRWTRVASTGACNFYYASDQATVPASWTLLGVQQTTTSGNIFDSTADLFIGVQSGGSSNPLLGNIYRAQIYSGIAGTLAFDFDPSVAAKLAGTVTERSANAATVTITSTGATGARISGARDLYQGTAANQPILTIAATGNYLTFDGSNDYLKASAFSLSQPETVYFVGSQVGWTASARIFDGGTTDSVLVQQITGSPRVRGFAGSFLSTVSTWATATPAIITSKFNGAASALRVNRNAAQADANAGSNAANGFTLGAVANGSFPANITVSEVLLYGQANGTSLQDRFIAYLARKWRIPT